MCGSGGRRGEGGWLCTTARSLLWCNQIISFDVSWIRSVRLEKNLQFSFVFKQIVNFIVVGTVALVFLQNSFYITSKESLWFSPNIVHWLFSNTVYEIKWITKGCLSSFWYTFPVSNNPPTPGLLQFQLSQFYLEKYLQIYNTTQRTTTRLSMLCKMRYRLISHEDAKLQSAGHSYSTRSLQY